MQFYEGVKLEVTAAALVTMTQVRQKKLRLRQKSVLNDHSESCVVGDNKCPRIPKSLYLDTVTSGQKHFN